MQGVAIALTLVVALAVAFAGARDASPATRVRWLAVLALAALVASAFVLRPAAAVSRVDPRVPRATDSGEYVSSRACRSCHPAEYASWRASYHSTMTQVADARTVLAPKDATLALDGRRYVFSARGDEVWVRAPDLDALMRDPKGAPDVERRVVLTTGSHHEQGYWVAGARGGELRLLPFVWVIPEARWVPRRDAFVQPPDAPQHFVRWNSNCIQCHATGGRPGHDVATDSFRTEAVELGVACEACHGPGGAHVRAHQSPIERWSARAKGERDPTIVQPAKLSPDRAAAVCGQCHSYAYPKDEEDWWLRGYATAFRPGRSLDTSRFLLTLERLGAAGVPAIDAETRSLYWGDGAIRVGGREYNALVVSGCHARGRGATCTSCHSMHEGAPDDQLDPKLAAGAGDAMCTQCHEEQGRDPSGHSHHRAGSSGAACVACHMPMTTYALFKTIRAHTIDSPRVGNAMDTGRPTACNLCHADRSLEWTYGWLVGWSKSALQPTPHTAGRSALFESALAGDAAVRVVVAAALGAPSTLEASGRDWERAALAVLLDDPYTAVRRVAWRSLVAIDPRAKSFDVLAPDAERAEMKRALLSGVRVEGDAARKEALFARPDGTIDTAALEAILALRDQRAVTIAE